MLKQYRQPYARIAKKLDGREMSLLLSPLVSTLAIAGSNGQSSSSSNDDNIERWLHLVEESYRELLERLNQPLMFLGPNGERWTEGEWKAYVFEQLLGDDDPIPG